MKLWCERCGRWVRAKHSEGTRRVHLAGDGKVHSCLMTGFELGLNQAEVAALARRVL